MNKNLRVIFLGTPDFAVESLKRIHESGRNIVGVITSPDRKAGRGQQLQQSAVKKYALSQKMNILQPTNLKDPDFLSELRKLNADIQVVVAFRMLPEKVWNMPALGTFNLHASLLPKYRGAAPINWAIINGEEESGVTTFFLKHEIDTGDLLFQEKVTISKEETAGSLHNKLMIKGGELVLRTLSAIEDGNYKPTPQADLDSDSFKAPKIYREDCKINWQDDAIKIDRLIRGLSPYPAAWTKFINKKNGKELNVKVFDVSLTHEKEIEAGKMMEDNGRILVGSVTKALEILELQVEGKKRMSASSLLNGFDINTYKIN